MGPQASLETRRGLESSPKTASNTSWPSWTTVALSRLQTQPLLRMPLFLIDSKASAATVERCLPIWQCGPPSYWLTKGDGYGV